MNSHPITLRNRACSQVPKQTRSPLGTVLGWLVDTDTQFRRTQSLLHPPGRWP